MAERSGETEAYQIWRELTRALILQFHELSFQGEEAKQVDAAIIELVSEYLWLDLGERAAWDTFDPHHWRSTVLMAEPIYRSRVRATLINFYEHLTTVGLVALPACSRIQDQLAECLADTAASATVRSSYMRLAVDLDAPGDVIPLSRRSSR